MNTSENFWEKLYIEPSGCWLWEGTIGSSGYGQFRIDGRTRPAHRWAYEYYIGPIPDGLVMDHLCRVRSCVNFNHLEPVTTSENIIRGIGPEMVKKRQALKTHCPQGHPYFGDNLRIWKNFRYCLLCKKLWTREKRKRERSGG